LIVQLVDTELVNMDETGKKNTTTAVGKIVAGTSTNLSGGLFKGFEVLSERKSPQDVSSVLLFTDGLANVGLTQSQDIVSGMENELKKSK